MQRGLVFLWLSGMFLPLTWLRANDASPPLPEHPRPQFRRELWANLNGVWNFDFDKDDVGVREQWFRSHDWSRTILVPYVHQSQKSGIGDTNHYRQVWYQRRFRVPPAFGGQHVRLHIGAVDFHATVWINGHQAGEYEGGYTPLTLDISEWLSADRAAENELVIRVFDDPLDPAQPRGKQHPSGKTNRWHYTHLTGIWQTVWLEAVPEHSIDRFQVTTQHAPPQAELTLFTAAPDQSVIRAELTVPGTDHPVVAGGRVENGQAVLVLRPEPAQAWSPDEPHLYDLQLQLGRGDGADFVAVDTVHSYVGFRTFEARDGKQFLNGNSIWLNGALDQGYWPETLYTHPSDQAAIDDIRLAKRLGLNHIRKHQMVADPRFLYHCDRLGILVWGEMANAGERHFSPRAAAIALREWQRVIERDTNHPSIITWCYSNENWMHGGTDEERIAHYRTAYRQLREWDPTRPIVDTSGYYHVQSDIMDAHRYPPQERTKALFSWARGELDDPAKNVVFLTDIPYSGQPILVSEWVGEHDFDGKSVASWLRAYLKILAEYAAEPLCAGHCYVQLYDIEAERNGYVTYDRQAKFSAEVEEILVRAHHYAQQRNLEFDWASFIEEVAPPTHAEGSINSLTSGQLAALTLSASTFKLQLVPDTLGMRVQLSREGRLLLTSPADGLWSLATAWQDDWPTGWQHAGPSEARREGPWLVLTGKLVTDEGDWEIRDAYRAEGSLVRCTRRWQWKGERPAQAVTLSARWQVPATGSEVKPMLPGICYYGNPSGAQTDPGRVATFTGAPGAALFCQEHRFPMPFASLEWSENELYYGAALHTLPSLVPHANVADQWWSLGVRADDKATELALLSGPVAMNGRPSFAKANQQRLLKYGDTWLDVPPGTIIEKTYFLEAYDVSQRGSGFRVSLASSLQRFQPFDPAGFPSFEKIVKDKVRFAKSRWHEDDASAGFRMYPNRNDYVMGWAGQAAAPGYALLVLAKKLDDSEVTGMAERSLNHLATSPLNQDGFMVRYDPESDAWSGQDPISQGQAMESFARAIAYGRQAKEIDTSKWEKFLRSAAQVHATRILQDDWRPRSTAEGFFISPLCRAHQLFGGEIFRQAALKAADHYRARHLDMSEPYWGGTLDAECEDKEGAWAGFQAFLAAYEMTQQKNYLEAAAHALDVLLTYTVIWDIEMPPGRLRDHGLKTRGWTVVSTQNQHLDVYGVLYTPEIYRMGTYLDREDLKQLARVMFRSAGQLMDPQGSQGEQLNHTLFAQQGNLDDVGRMRGTYVERWTVFWITAHFLNAAAQFEEMGLPLDF